MGNPFEGRSWWAVVAAVALCGVGLTGCGEDDGSGGGTPAEDGGRRIGTVDGGRTADAVPGGQDHAGPGEADRGDAAPPLPACSDGRDNDRDGRVDDNDPGCSSPDDEDELDEVRPQCADEVDNDNDGRIDLEDADCADATGLAEAGFDPTKACGNGLDDDDDGWIDFPLDPGCAAVGDDDERDLPDEPPACADGIDNDGDGIADWPEDPGCAGRGDGDEADPGAPPACANGLDDDGDGLTDHPEDFGCTGAGEYSELGGCGALRETLLLEPGQVFDGDTSEGAPGFEGTCGGAEGPELVFEYRLDRPVAALVFSTVHPETEVGTVVYVRRGCNGREVACDAGGDQGAGLGEARVDGALPGTYFVFVDTRGAEGGRVRLTSEQIRAPECRDGRDNDGDGRTDLRDPGCESLVDPTEADPEQPPACANRVDDDEDGRTDYPSDPGCLAAGWATEVEICGPGTEVEELALPLAGTVTREIRADADVVQSTCDGAELGPEHLFTFVLEQAARVRVSTQHPGTAMRTAVTVRRDCGDAETEIACVRGGSGQEAPTGAEVAIPVLEPGRYFVIVEADGEPGTFEMSLEAEPLGPPCSDGLDNDDDGRIDGEDPGCAAADDADEADDVEGPTACANGQDDDGDGLIDHPYDPGCFGVGDDDESDPEVAPACANRFDDDGDGLLDFSTDPGCHGAGDDDERDPAQPPACTDGADNDQDGLTDEPFDPGCAGPGDFGEGDPRAVPTCDNNADDDEDGLVDWPADPGCRGRGDGDEADPEELPACANGEDDDGDSVADYPEEPGCVAAGDPDEANPPIPPRCANGFDDDADGLTDYPDDPGCLSAGDTEEENPPFCGNGEDDDADGLIDLADPGCESRFDPDERHDPENLPECADGVDNDEDGAVDWPEDPECRAAGFRAELPACGLDALTIEIAPDGGIIEIPEPETPDTAQGTCGGNRDENEVVLVIRPAERSRIVVATQGGGDPHLYARTTCEDEDTELACDDDSGPGDQGSLELADVEAGTYFVFVDGRRTGPLTVSVTIESLVRACNDGFDNDEDGLVDLDDPGCEHDMDDDEAHDPESPPECGDGIDNDGDGRTDYPDDPDCAAAGGRAEAEQCAEAEVIEMGQAGGTISIDTRGAPNAYQAGCEDTESPERVIALTLDFPSEVVAEVFDNDNGDFDTVMFARSACDDPGTELACDDDGGDDLLASRLELRRLEPGTYFIFVEGYSNDAGVTDLRIDVRALVVACGDGIDNDEDGQVDAADPGCTHLDDADETDPDEVPACADGIDNDEDGFVDRADLACRYAGDASEEQACAERDAPDITADGGVTLNNAELPDTDATAACGGIGAGDAIYRFRVTEEQAGGTLVASVANEGTAIDGAVVAVRRFCDQPFSEFGCGRGEDGTVRIPDAESGEYYVIVDGVGTPRSPSRGGPVPLVDGEFVAGQAFTEPDADGLDYWDLESGDRLGGVTVWHDNLPTGISVVPGEREVDANGLPIRVISDLAAPTVLRVQLLPADEDTGPVFIESFSAVAADFGTVAEERTFEVGDLEIPYFVINDDPIDEPPGFLDDPQVVFVVVPGRAEQIGAVQYRHLGDGLVRIRAAIDLPAILYFVPGTATTAEVTAAIAEDIFVPGEVVSTGDIELTVEVVPAGE